MKMAKGRPKNLKSLSTTELVDLFEQISLAKGEALENNENARFNRLYKRKRALLSEMRHRPGDARRALLVFYDHRHPYVRLSVATSTYALDPERAKAAMRAIRASRHLPWSFEAGMSLGGLDEGTSALLYDPE